MPRTFLHFTPHKKNGATINKKKTRKEAFSKKQTKNGQKSYDFSRFRGATKGTRTPSLRFRRPTLYPIELWMQTILRFYVLINRLAHQNAYIV